MNKQEERSLLMIKPDGIEKNLAPIIKRLIAKKDLTIEKEKRTKLNRKMTIALYKEYEQRSNFFKLIDFITSQPVVIFLVKGKSAVSKIRQIIGKKDPPSGLRKIYAEDIIRNVAHGPDSLKTAQREIQLIFGKEVHLK